MSDLPDDLSVSPLLSKRQVLISSVSSLLGIDAQLLNAIMWFTCIYSRAMHSKICTDMTSDSFILALCRFIAICGPVLCIWWDSGNNFVGACNELKASQFYGKNPIK